jgi:hypothetical protein
MKKIPLDYGYFILLLGLLTLATTAYAVWQRYSPVPFSECDRHRSARRRLGIRRTIEAKAILCII